MEEFSLLIGSQPRTGNFKHDRLDWSVYANCGLQMPRRRYDKVFRLSVQMEERLTRLHIPDAIVVAARRQNLTRVAVSH